MIYYDDGQILVRTTNDTDPQYFAKEETAQEYGTTVKHVRRMLTAKMMTN